MDERRNMSYIKITRLLVTKKGAKNMLTTVSKPNEKDQQTGSSSISASRKKIGISHGVKLVDLYKEGK